MLFELFTRKMLEDSPMGTAADKVGLELTERTPIVYSRLRNPFNEYFIPATFAELKRREELPEERGFIVTLLRSKKALKEEDYRAVREFVLLSFSENAVSVTEKKLKRLRARLEQMYTNRHSVKCLLSLFAFSFMNRELREAYNPAIMPIFEDVIIQNVANFFDATNYDYDSIFKLLFVCYEFHASAVHFGQTLFSPKFLKFIRNLSVWFREPTWDKMIETTIAAAHKNEPVYFLPIPSVKPHKKRLKLMSQVYELNVMMGFHFLRLSFPQLFDSLNAANDRRGHIATNLLQDLSREIEGRIVGGLGDALVSKRERFKSLTRQEAVAKVFKWSLKFLEVGEDRLVKLTLLSKFFSAALTKAVVKSYLLSDRIDEETRRRIWTEIAAFERKEQELASTVGAQLDERTLHVIAMDVRRTNFAKFEKEKLQKLLTEVAMAHPNMLYYQGMNCIGGYLLNYCNDYEISRYVFSFLIRKRLEAYFTNNFARIKTLLYIAERLIAQLVPTVHARLEELKISNEFFLSPLILTVFTSYLQFIENYTLVSKIMDLFIVEGWVGFFQVLVLIFRHIERRIIGLDYDVLLEFLNKNIYEHLFLNPPPNLKAEALRVLVTKRMIRALEREYDHRRKVVDEYWVNYYDRKRKGSSTASAPK